MLDWQTLGKLPAFSRSAALCGDTLYSIGSNKRDTVAMDLASGEYVSIPPCKHHKRSATLVSARDMLLLVGNKGIVSGYDPLQRTWSDMGRLERPMFRTSAIGTGTALYLVGGRVHSERGARAMQEIERFDLTAGTSQTIGLLPRPLSDSHVAERPDGAIDILGGDWVTGASMVGESNAAATDEWLLLDPITHNLTNVGTTPQPISLGGAAWGPDGRLYLVAGAEQGVAVFAPTTSTWATESPLPDPGSFADAFVWNGRLIVARSGAVHAADLGTGESGPPLQPATGGTSFVVVARGEAGPFATREEAERVSLELLRAGLTVEIEQR